MRIKNHSRSAIPLSGAISIPAGGEVNLAADAIHLLDRPRIKAYLRDGSLKFADAGSKKTAMTAKAPAKGPKGTDADASGTED